MTEKQGIEILEAWFAEKGIARDGFRWMETVNGGHYWSYGISFVGSLRSGVFNVNKMTKEVEDNYGIFN